MLEVLTTGLYTSIQDSGRFDFQDIGVPISGAMDRYSATLANLILGNDKHDAVLEITLIGPKLKFHTTTTITITGAEMSPRINETTVSMNTILEVKSGDILTFGKLITGCRTYLAVLGGFNETKVMKSYSMFEGITSHAKIYKGAQLLYKVTPNPLKPKLHAHLKPKNHYFDEKEILVFKGPEYDFLSNKIKQDLFSFVFTISKENSRMGYQLEETLKNQLKPIITSAVMPGTVQLTPGGQIIILMRDAQTTGGYPRIFQLTESSINQIAQKKTGDSLMFRLI